MGPWLRTTAFRRQKNRSSRNKGARGLEGRRLDLRSLTVPGNKSQDRQVGGQSKGQDGKNRKGQETEAKIVDGSSMKTVILGGDDVPEEAETTRDLCQCP